MFALGTIVALSTTTATFAQVSASTANALKEEGPVTVSRVGETNREALRVIFLAGSDYSNFRIGMENQSKSTVNVEVTDESGAVVYTEKLKKVYKRVKELDLSFLKRGEYVVRVFNQDNEFSKVLRVP